MKALVGSWETHPHKLIAEITALRSKVAELKAEVESLRAENTMLKDGRIDALREPEPELVSSSS